MRFVSWKVCGKTIAIVVGYSSMYYLYNLKYK